MHDTERFFIRNHQGSKRSCGRKRDGNASLLSRELDTSLTGRHLTYELFPFSYTEFLRFKNLKEGEDSVKEYMLSGGFPEYLKTPGEEILVHMLDDILVRDIAVRYGIKDTQGLKRLAVYLLSNIGNASSVNKLRGPSGIGSATTVSEYISYLEQSYLIQLVPMFDLSLKKQSVNPPKIYAIDTGLVGANTSSLKTDEGHKLENMVFNSLRSKYKEIYYHKGKKECDFILIEKGIVSMAVQVCLTLNKDNMEREFGGLTEAMQAYHLKKGTLLTLRQEDSFQIEGLEIRVVPAGKFFKASPSATLAK